MTVCISANGDVVHLAADRPTALIVATAAGLVRLEEPGDGGEWRVAACALDGFHVAALVRHPDSGRLFAGLHYDGGLMASDDDGMNWRPIGKGIESGHIYMLAAQRRPAGVRLYAGTEPPMLYYSDDAGENWTALRGMWDVPDTDQWRFPPPPHFAHVKNIAFHPAEPDILYMCVEQGDLLKSEDGGVTWRPLTDYESAEDKFRRDMHRTVIKPSNPDDLFLASGCGLYRTADAGEHFTHVHAGDARVGYPDCLFLHPDDEDTVYIAGAARAPNPSWAGTGSADPAILRSRDSGATWEEVMTGLPRPVPGNIEAMANCSWPGGFTLFAGGSTGEIYASDDGGEQWRTIARGLRPMSKGAHYRHFATPEQRSEIETALKRRMVGA